MYKIRRFDNTVISGTNRSPRQMLPTRNTIISYNVYNNQPRLRNFSRNLYWYTPPTAGSNNFFSRYTLKYTLSDSEEGEIACT